MKSAQRVLAMLAVLVLVTQTVRHVYVRWFQPRTSVLDRFDRPLSDRIAAAKSLEELAQLYEPVRRAADLKRKESGQERNDVYLRESREEEPYRSENELRKAIESWEAKAREIHSLRFYWLVGVVLVAFGGILFSRNLRWLGLTLEVAGFAEIVYWTSPTFFGGGVQEFDRLVTYKVVMSVLSLAILAAISWRQEIFREGSVSSSAV